jgi:hypothetical protein
MSNLNDFKMPRFFIDTINEDGKVIPGIKRMYDIALATKDSIMQWGGPGIGKSQAVLQWNQQKVEEYNQRIANGENIKPWNPKVCDVRLSMKEPVDMIGVPTIQVETVDGKGKPVTVWATPSVWPQSNEYSGGVIHLDEMNQGQAAILNAAFQLIQDRQLGEYKVPDGYLIIASSNPPAFNSTVTELSVPLSNRFSHFNIVANFDSWLNYRMNHGGNLDVMTFLKTQGEQMLYDNDTMKKRVGSEADTMYTDIVVTPRSWEIAERVLALPDSEFTIDEKQKYITGRLGLTLTAKLFNYIKEKAKYQDWREVLVQGKDFKSEDANVFWAVHMACLAAMINEPDDKKCREYVLNFIKATRNLKSDSLKTINISAIAKTPRIMTKPGIFSPMQDCNDLIKLASKAIL